MAVVACGERASLPSHLRVGANTELGIFIAEIDFLVHTLCILFFLSSLSRPRGFAEEGTYDDLHLCLLQFLYNFC
jgi:hypothetical protein